MVLIEAIIIIGMDFSSFGICIGHIFLILISNASKLDCTIDFSDMDQSSMIGGLYADNGIDQTIMYAPLPKEEKKHVQEELLGLLGLHSRPRPLNQETSQAAPKYMLNLYQSFVDEEGADLKVDGDKLLARVRDGTLSGNNVTLSSMNEADEIISFPNQGKTPTVPYVALAVTEMGILYVTR